MEEFLRYVIGSLVESPDQVVIKKTETPGRTVFHVAAKPSDMARIVGKGGHTIRALRSLLAASARKRNQSASLELIEP
ncbi:MAG: KH domain-containing protein [Terrimicrobiaceae bacterium]